MLQKIHQKFPNIKLVPDTIFRWSPEHNAVFYNEDRLHGSDGQLTLLHEVSHALLDHQYYDLDIELVKMEVEAWERARKLAEEFNLKIDESHIQHCLNSYRKWVYKRSLCPNCDYTAPQQNASTYSCFICNQSWNVSEDCSTRPYRKLCAA